MISPIAFAAAQLAILFVILIWAGAIRRGRTDPWPNRRAKYRRLTTEAMLKRLHKLQR